MDIVGDDQAAGRGAGQQRRGFVDIPASSSLAKYIVVGPRARRSARQQVDVAVAPNT